MGQDPEKPEATVPARWACPLGGTQTRPTQPPLLGDSAPGLGQGGTGVCDTRRSKHLAGSLVSRSGPGGGHALRCPPPHGQGPPCPPSHCKGPGSPPDDNILKQRSLGASVTTLSRVNKAEVLSS